MEATIPAGWDQDSHTLYLHPSGVRIERRVYRHKESWILVPVDLDQAVLEFTPNSDGLELAFAAFARGGLSPKGAAPTGHQGKLAQEAARRDEKLEEASDDAEQATEDEEEEDGA